MVYPPLTVSYPSEIVAAQGGGAPPEWLRKNAISYYSNNEKNVIVMKSRNVRLIRSIEGENIVYAYGDCMVPRGLNLL